VTVVVAGEALIDLVVGQDGSVGAFPGGGPYNTARTIARLGVACCFLGRLSTDRFGRRLTDELAADGVGLELAQMTDDPTTLALAELDAAGGAAYRFYLEGTSAPGLAEAVLPPDAAAVHVGTLGLRLEPIGSSLERLVVGAPESAIVMLDVNARSSVPGDREPWRRRIGRIAERADVVKASRPDLRFLGMSAAELLALGAGVVLVTDGPEAVEVWHGRVVESVPVPAIEVVDTVGAGDAFGGGFLGWCIEHGAGRDVVRDGDVARAAARHGAEVAALTCTRRGADPPTAAELATWVAARDSRS
jgi:fructokinase